MRVDTLPENFRRCLRELTLRPFSTTDTGIRMPPREKRVLLLHSRYSGWSSMIAGILLVLWEV